MNNLQNNKKIVKKIKTTILERNSIAEETTEIALSLQGQEFIFSAGQYIEATIPGDNLEDNIREFSISSSPNEKDVIRITFRNSESAYKKKILSLPIGSEIEIHGPLGVFILPEEQHPIVMIAGGIGITPFLSIIRYVIENKLPYNINLIYSNSTVARSAYIKELRELSKNNENFTLSENLGMLDTDFIKNKTKDFAGTTLWYICGLPEMVDSVRKDIVIEIGVKEENIRFESYSGYKNGWEKRKFLKLETKEGLAEEDFSQDKGLKKLANTLLKTLDKTALVAITNVRGDILYVNQLFLEISKYSKEELVGQNHRIVKSGYHPDSYYKELWDTISSGRIWRGEIKNKAKDGTFYWVDTSIAPILSEDGRPEQYVAVRFPITDKKVLEEKAKEYSESLELKVDERTKELKSEKDRLNTILYSIGDGVFVVDRNLNIIIMNDTASELSGYGVDESIGRPYKEILNFIFEKDGKANDDFINQAIITGETQSMGDHTQIIRKDGEKVAVSDSAAPLKDKDGDVIGVVVVFRDVSKEREVDKAKTEFVSLASHQLRTPLTSIGWYAEMLLSGDAGEINEDQKNYLTEIDKGNKRMVDLVDSLLSVSRIDLGTFAIEPKPTDFIDISNTVIKELKTNIEKKGTIIKTDYDELPLIEADPSLTRIIFQNFISNAVKYTPDGGEVTVRIKKQDPNILISVSDNGYGIPKDQQNKIFQKLFRADNIQNKDVEGNGLGLYVVKAIVEKSGGKIWFESEENKGTTFSATLPLSGMKKKEGSRGLK